MADPGTTGTLTLKNLTTAPLLAAKRKEIDDLRADDNREWALNRAFYKGDQWVMWDRLASQVVSLPTMDGDKPLWKVRLTSDQIKPGLQHYVALLTKTKPTTVATPDSSSYRDVCASQVAETLFEYWWPELQLQSKLDSALTYAGLSQGYWEICYDELAGKSMNLVLDPNGQPITNEELADVFLDNLRDVAKQQGVDADQLVSQHTKTVYVGDISVDPLPGENVWLDPAPKNYTDARYVIIKKSMDIDEVEARYGKTVEPNTSPSETSTPLIGSRRIYQRPKTLRDVFCMYIRPNPSLPKGRKVEWIEDPDVILKDGPWSYPFNELPIVKWPGIENPESSVDIPIVTGARPLQKELNRTLSQMIVHKDLTIKPQMIAPLGSLAQELTDEPGAVFEFNPIAGMQPEWRQMPGMPASTFSILQDIQARIDRCFNRIPAQRDQLPARVDAGYSIEMIQETIADQLTPTIRRIEEGLARAGWLMVLLAKEYYKEPRLLKIKGANGSYQVRKFQNADLQGGFSFRCEAGSGLPRSRAGRQQRILDLVTAQVISPQDAVKFLDLADMRSIQNALEADEDQAYREHEKLIKGEPTNPTGVQDAQQQAQGIIEQMTQQLSTFPPEAQQAQGQQMMQQAQQQAQETVLNVAFGPTDYEDWNTHIQIHSLFMKTTEWENLPEDAKQRFLRHYNQTYQKLIQVKQAQAALDPKAMPQLGVTARATVSAPVMGEILKRHGIDVDPQAISQKPLETAVYDSTDKADQSDAGNNPLDQMEQMLMMQQAQDAHEVAMSQAESKHASASHKASLDSIQGTQAIAHQTQEMAHAQQQHDLQMQQAEEAHQEKLRQMRKPKPSGGSSKSK